MNVSLAPVVILDTGISRKGLVEIVPVPPYKTVGDLTAATIQPIPTVVRNCTVADLPVTSVQTVPVALSVVSGNNAVPQDRCVVGIASGIGPDSASVRGGRVVRDSTIDDDRCRYTASDPTSTQSL